MRISIVLLLICSSLVSAQETTSPEASSLEGISSPQTQSSLSSTSSSAFHQQWQLEPAEVNRFETLKNQYRPFADVENMTPYEILGMGAETQSERKKYAKLFVESMVAHQVTTFQWSVTVSDVVGERDYGADIRKNPQINRFLNAAGSDGILRGDTAMTVAAQESSFANSAPARMHLFLDDQCTTCDALYSAASNLLDSGGATGIDLIFPKTHSDSEISKWAVDRKISTDDVRSGLITLNRSTRSFENELQGRSTPILINTRTGHALQ